MLVLTRKSKHSQQCHDPCQQCFCCWLTVQNSMHGKSGGLSVARDARKPGVDSMACATEHCSRKKPAWLTYTASGNIPLCLKTGTGFLSLVTSTFDLTHIYVGPKNRPYFMSAKNVTAWAAVYTVRWFTEPQTVTHPSTNPARRRSTTSVETNVLPLSQTVERENSEYFRTSIIHTCLVYTFPIHHPGSMNTR